MFKFGGFWLDDIRTSERDSYYVFVILFWQAVLDGKYDDLSEQSFYMVGGIEEVIAKAEKIAKESAA